MASLLGALLVFVRWLAYPTEPEAFAATGTEVLPSPSHVGLAIVRTSYIPVRQAMLYEGGSLTTVVENDFSAFLIKHDTSYLLFDTGLGRRIDAQYRADMAIWKRPFFKYGSSVAPARDQLDRASISIDRIFLSHSHWDHASALEDFPEASVWVPEAEREYIRRSLATGSGAWASQVGSSDIRWSTYALTTGPYEGFERSLDVFGDHSVVIVPLTGHTEGSVGMFVTVDSGKRILLCGDAVWSATAIAEARPRTAVARGIVDADAERAGEALARIRAISERDPTTVIVPAHDGIVQRELGYFPSWVR